MRGLADNGAFWVMLIAVAVVLYLLPTLVGLVRGVDGLVLVFLVNLIGGTALIGWPAAMILAFGPPPPIAGDNPGQLSVRGSRPGAVLGAAAS